MKSLFALVLLLAVAIGLYYFVDVDITKEARLPDVDLQVTGGQLPEAEIKTGSINVTEENVKVKVPEVDVKMVEKNVKVPGLEVKTPAENSN